MMLHDQDESVPSAQTEARELAWRGGDSSASVCRAEPQHTEGQSLTSPWRNVNLDRQGERGAVKETDRQDRKRVVLT